MNEVFWKQFMAVVMALALSAASAAGGLQITEILADPASDWDGNGEISTRGDEWIEIANSGPGDFDLADFYIRDALGADPQMQFSGLLAAGEVAVFYGSDAELWQAENGVSISGLSLNNAGDQLELFFGHPTDPQSSLMDIVIYPGHAVVDDRSYARFLPDDVWVIFDGLNPYTGTLEPGGSGCDPSPGVANACAGLVEAGDTTWADVKQTYR